MITVLALLILMSCAPMLLNPRQIPSVQQYGIYNVTGIVVNNERRDTPICRRNHSETMQLPSAWIYCLGYICYTFVLTDEWLQFPSNWWTRVLLHADNSIDLSLIPGSSTQSSWPYWSQEKSEFKPSEKQIMIWSRSRFMTLQIGLIPNTVCQIHERQY